jgi:hypothetical protein
VYAITTGKDEFFDCASMRNHAYGAHRLAFEIFCNNKFVNCSIVRLPGLFGEGLKKNVVFDFLNDNCLELINPNSSFQYYYLKNIWKDISVVLDDDIRCINFFTEPVTTQLIHSVFFPSKCIGQQAEGMVSDYDLHTRYASSWNVDGNYIYSQDEMIQQLSEFIGGYRKIREGL